MSCALVLLLCCCVLAAAGSEGALVWTEWSTFAYCRQVTATGAARDWGSTPSPPLISSNLTQGCGGDNPDWCESDPRCPDRPTHYLECETLQKTSSGQEVPQSVASSALNALEVKFRRQMQQGGLPGPQTTNLCEDAELTLEVQGGTRSVSFLEPTQSSVYATTSGDRVVAPGTLWGHSPSVVLNSFNSNQLAVRYQAQEKQESSGCGDLKCSVSSFAVRIQYDDSPTTGSATTTTTATTATTGTTGTTELTTGVATTGVATATTTTTATTKTTATTARSIATTGATGTNSIIPTATTLTSISMTSTSATTTTSTIVSSGGTPPAPAPTVSDNTSSSDDTALLIPIIAILAGFLALVLILVPVTISLRRRRQAIGESDESDKSLPAMELNRRARKDTKKFDTAGAGAGPLETIDSDVGFSATSTDDEDQASQRASAIFGDSDYLSVVIEKKVGKGAFGAVFLGRWSDQDVAVKCVDSGDLAELEAELAILKRLNHPRIVRLFGVTEAKGDLAMVLEWCPGGSLDVLLVQRRDLGPPDFHRFCLQISQGLAFLAAKNVLHRDLACRNVLADSNTDCKITDFGLSRAVSVEAGGQGEYKVTSSAVPIRWTAPEVLVEKAATALSDVYSLGIVMVEVYSRAKRPYAYLATSNEVVAAVLGGDRPGQPNCMPEAVYKLAAECWATQPADRPKASAVAARLAALDDGTKPEVVPQKQIVPGMIGGAEGYDSFVRADEDAGLAHGSPAAPSADHGSNRGSSDHPYGMPDAGVGANVVAGAAAEYGSNRTSAVAGAAAEYGSNRASVVLPVADFGVAAVTAQPSSGDLGDGYGTLESNRE